jgi:hypothetical protein
MHSLSEGYVIENRKTRQTTTIKRQMKSIRTIGTTISDDKRKDLDEGVLKERQQTNPSLGDEG